MRIFVSEHYAAIFLGVLFLCVVLLICWVFFVSDGGQRGISFDIDSTGKKIVFSANGEGGRDLFLLDLITKKVSRVTQTPLYERTPSFSSDGQTILYTGSSEPLSSAHLYTCTLDGKNRTQLTFGETTYDESPRFSPDGKEIVFARSTLRREYSMGGWKWSHWDVYKCKADGSEVARLTTEQSYDLYPPFWTPDGKSVLYNDDANTYLLSLTTGERRLIPEAKSFPFLSPDGKEVGYVASGKKEFDYEVWLTTLKGEKHLLITDTKAYNTYPRFLPDGKSILFLSDQRREHRYDLWQVNADGKNLHRIADSTLFANPLRWKPN